MRDPGLYWVRVSGEWTIAEWDPVSLPQMPCWLLIGSDEPCRAVLEVGARVDRTLTRVHDDPVKPLVGLVDREEEE